MTQLLAGNSFTLPNAHANAAAKIYGAKGYAARQRSMDGLLSRARADAGNIDQVVSAQASLDQFSAAVAQVLRVLGSAQDEFKAKGPPSIWFYQSDSQAAPSGIDADSWNLAWYVDLSALSNLMPKLDQLAIAADRLIDLAAGAAKAAQGKKWVTTDQAPIDWSKSDDLVLRPEAVKAAKAAADAAVKAGKYAVGVGLGGLAIVAVIAVAGLLLWKGGKRG